MTKEVMALDWNFLGHQCTRAEAAGKQGRAGPGGDIRAGFFRAARGGTERGSIPGFSPLPRRRQRWKTKAAERMARCEWTAHMQLNLNRGLDLQAPRRAVWAGNGALGTCGGLVGPVVGMCGGRCGKLGVVEIGGRVPCPSGIPLPFRHPLPRSPTLLASCRPVSAIRPRLLSARPVRGPFSAWSRRRGRRPRCRCFSTPSR